MLTNPEHNKDQLRGSDIKNLFSVTGNQLDSLRLDVSNSSNVDTMKESLETDVDIYQENYEVSQSETDSKEVREMRKKEPVFLLGSVDASGFRQVWHKPDWYTPFLTAAEDISANFDLLDPETQAWCNEVSPALEIFKNLGSMDGRSFKRNYKNEIYKLCRSKGSKMVYGPKGALNFLLAYNRVKNICPTDFKTLGVEKIKLVVGYKKGKITGAPERRAYMLVRKFPKLGSEEFFEKYEIKDRAEFNKYMTLFGVWMDSSPINIFDSDLINSLNVESGEKLLLMEGASNIHQLIADFDIFSLTGNFANFLDDIDNPDAQKLRKLLFAAVSRTIEFYEKKYLDYLRKSGEFGAMQYAKSEMNGLYRRAVKVGGEIIEKDSTNVEVLNQVVESSEYLLNEPGLNIGKVEIANYQTYIARCKKLLASLK